MSDRLQAPSAGRTLLVTAVALLAAFFGGGLHAQQSFPSDDDLRSMLRYLVEDGETAGVVLGLLESDGSTRILSCGESGVARRPLDRESVFEIGSVTKTFTGALLAEMVARDEVSLSDAVATYLPSSVDVPGYDGAAITLLDLATHRSGLPAAPPHTPADLTNPWADWTIEDLYGFLSTYELDVRPGTRYTYSNLGMGLLGHALARAAGTTLRDLMRQRILAPLGMTSTGYALDGEIAESSVRGHAGGGEVPFWFTTEAAEGAGGLRSNAVDMLAYLAANLGPPSSDLERAMQVAQAPRSPTEDGSEEIGLGWITTAVNGRTIRSHSGGTGGFRTRVVMDPDRDIGVVLMANSASFADDLAFDLVARDYSPDEPVTAVGRGRLEAYVGVYESDGGLPLYIRIDEDGNLTGQGRDQIRWRLYASSDSSFVAKRVPFGITFRRDAQGGVSHLVLEVEGRTNRFDRTSNPIPRSIVVAGNAARDVSVDLNVYEGTYVLQIGSEPVELRVFVENDALMAELGGRARSRLLPQGDHTFRVAIRPGDSIVFRVEGDRASSLVFSQGGQQIAGERRE